MDIQEYINPTFKKLHNLNLKLELRSGSNGWDKVYLTDMDGVRITDALYRGNREKGNSDERFRTARQGSHKDGALKELFNKYQRIEEFGIPDKETTMKKEMERTVDRWALAPSKMKKETDEGSTRKKLNRFKR